MGDGAEVAQRLRNEGWRWPCCSCDQLKCFTDFNARSRSLIIKHHVLVQHDARLWNAVRHEHFPWPFEEERCKDCTAIAVAKRQIEISSRTAMQPCTDCSLPLHYFGRRQTLYLRYHKPHRVRRCLRCHWRHRTAWMLTPTWLASVLVAFGSARHLCLAYVEVFSDQNLLRCISPYISVHRYRNAGLWHVFGSLQGLLFLARHGGSYYDDLFQWSAAEQRDLEGNGEQCEFQLHIAYCW